MKLLSFQHDGTSKVGVMDGSQIAPIDDVSMIALLEMGEQGIVLARQALAGERRISAEKITYLPPVIRPGKVIALGRNYAAHAREGGAEPPDFPMLFHKTHTSLNSHLGDIVIPPTTEKVDYEAELAVIIGKTCKNVSETDALDYVAGYACANDVTARDWQRRTSQFTAGKMIDGFAPLGPYLVTADEVPDVQNLDIQLWHNDQLMQSSNTRMMIFSVAFTISYISKITTLEVGDVILTGTPEGVGFARKPPVFMQAGDVVTVEVAGIGRLTNHFIA